MKVAAVVQRYGPDIYGGSETLCRSFLSRLPARGIEVEVFTTCARDHATWANVFPEGTSEDQGVTVRRFPTSRRSRLFPLIHRRLMSSRDPSLEDQERWMDAQGPRSPSLVTAVANESERFDLILYFTYLYYPTYFGIKRTAHKAVLHPTAHDEPTFYLSMFKHMFHSSAGFVFLSPEERRLVIDQFDLHDPMNVVVGSGMEKPLAVPRESFREAFDIRSPYLLCLGRQERAKGSHYLCEWFANFKLKHPSDLKLVLAGSGNYRPPSNPSIIQVGPLSESLKWTALEDAEVLIQPSFHESLSLVVLEAWAASTPVMVNGWCDVTRGLCSRSQGGVWYRNYLEFETALDALMEDRDLRDGLAAGGMRHVAVHCAWDGVMERYVSFLRDVADHV